MQLPKFDQLAIKKATIENYESFEALVNMYRLVIIDESDDYYILDGNSEDLSDFKSFWLSSD